MTIEIYRDIPGYEGRYMISNLGNVYSLPKRGSGGHNGKILKSHIDKKFGYVSVKLQSKKGFSYHVHRLVSIAFLSNSYNKPCVNHKNGIKTDNRVENLEWCTQSENIQHSIKVLGNKPHFQSNKVWKSGGENHNARKINQYDLSGNFIKTWGSLSEISRAYKIPTTNISKCCQGLRKKAGGFIFTYQKPLGQTK